MSATSLKQKWAQFRGDPAGERFERHYWRRRQHCKGALDPKRYVNGLGGLVVLVVGLVLVPAPGPGWLIVAVGLALIGGEVLGVARFMDKAELFLRRSYAKLRGRKAETPKTPT